MLLGKMDSVCTAATGLVCDAGQWDSISVFSLSCLCTVHAVESVGKTEERNQQPDSKQLKSASKPNIPYQVRTF